MFPRYSLVGLEPESLFCAVEDSKDSSAMEQILRLRFTTKYTMACPSPKFSDLMYVLLDCGIICRVCL